MHVLYNIDLSVALSKGEKDEMTALDISDCPDTDVVEVVSLVCFIFYTQLHNCICFSNRIL